MIKNKKIKKNNKGKKQKNKKSKPKKFERIFKFILKIKLILKLIYLEITFEESKISNQDKIKVKNLFRNIYNLLLEGAKISSIIPLIHKIIDILRDRFHN